jgi:hypothetical protein
MILHSLTSRINLEYTRHLTVSMHSTIPDCDVVIDLGRHKNMSYSSHTHSSSLVDEWVSQASAIQRAGRTGQYILFWEEFLIRL